MKLGIVFNAITLYLSAFAVRCHVMILRQRGRSITIGGNPRYFGKPILMLKKNTRFHMGSNCVLRSSFKSNALGIRHPIIFCTLEEKAELIIGDDVGISGGTFCAATSIRIGKSALIGANTTIVDTDFHPIGAIDRLENRMDKTRRAAISIGENVFIGTGSTILKGVNIGDNSVIGAGSVVTKDIPSNVIAAGNPCVVIRRLSS